MGGGLSELKREARLIVDDIAGHISRPDLRAAFLGSPAVMALSVEAISQPRSQP